MQVVQTIEEAHSKSIASLRFSPNGQYLASASTDTHSYHFNLNLCRR